MRDDAALVQTLISAVVFIQLLGAVLTFTPMRDRKLGPGRLSLVAFVVVLLGARRGDFFKPAFIPSIVGLVAALALFMWARITIQGKMFSYISSTDVPQFVCSSGPFRWIRHPFYASYLLTLLSATIAFPNLITAIGFIAAVFTFNAAASYEESKFEGSPAAAEYAAYIQRTARFVPILF